MPKDSTGAVFDLAALSSDVESLFEGTILDGRTRAQARTELHVAVGAHLETLVESILVKPATNRGGRVDPERVVINPRVGVSARAL